MPCGSPSSRLPRRPTWPLARAKSDSVWGSRSRRSSLSRSAHASTGKVASRITACSQASGLLPGRQYAGPVAGSPQPARDAPLRGAIFDVDGVLVDSPHEQAWRETLDRLMQGPWREAAAGTSWQPGALTSEVYAAQVAGKPREDGARAVLESIGLQDRDGARVAEYAAARQERVQELIDQHVFRPYEDALRFLERLRAAGVRVAAASSSQNAPALLSRIRLDGAGTVRDALDADLSGRRF